MIYKNGEDVFPPELLRELQKYIHGELVYIPKSSSKRAGWGESNGTRLAMQNRNKQIFSLYKTGVSIAELSKRYHLSEDSIRKIISKLNKNDHILNRERN
ncbi:MAG: CD3324 family protein [Clostridia bacterium]|nr:CD3324 family protein [Clostridia bacterium]